MTLTAPHHVCDEAYIQVFWIPVYTVVFTADTGTLKGSESGSKFTQASSWARKDHLTNSPTQEAQVWNFADANTTVLSPPF